MGYYQLHLKQKIHLMPYSRLYLAVLLILSLVLFAPSSSAHEVNPSDNINPVQSEPAIGHLPEDINLNEKDINALAEISVQYGNHPNWWNWITSASSKPANYHYIDILELLN